MLDAMSREPLRIEVVSDTVCPWCFIGKRLLQRALEAFDALDVTVVWQPYFLDPRVPREGVDAREYTLAKFGIQGARQLSSRLSSAATEAGVELRLDLQRRRPNTLDSHRLIHWAQQDGVQDAVVEALFCGYFCEGRDIGDREQLAALAAAHGMNGARVRERLESHEDEDTILSQVEGQEDRGVSGVPWFFIEGFPVPGAQQVDLFERVIQRVLSKRRSAQ